MISPPYSASRRTPLAVIRLAFLTCAALAISACSDEPQGDAAGAPPPGQADQVRPTEVITARSETVSYETELPGRARAYERAEIRPQVTGLIEKRLFTQGDNVETGQALYQIDSAEYAAARDSAQASVNRAEAAAEVATQTVNRYENLAEINAISQQDYDDALAAQKQAAADVGVARAALQSAQIRLNRTTIRSPISGRIGRSAVTPGALVTENQMSALAEVVRLDPIYVDLTVSSAELLRWRRAVSAGQISTNEEGNAQITVLFENGEIYPEQGELEFTETVVDETEGSIAVRAVLPNPDGLILPGMYLAARIEAGNYANAFLVPQSVVTRTPRGDAQALVVGDDGTVESRRLTIPRARGNSWIVTDGLQNGDQIIVSGLQTLRDGTSVTPQPASAETLSKIAPNSGTAGPSGPASQTQ